MSWLTNVNNLLTKLDDEVGVAVEERTFDEASTEVGGIDRILEKRGLLLVAHEEDTEEALVGEEEIIEESETAGTEESPPFETKVDQTTSNEEESKPEVNQTNDLVEETNEKSPDDSQSAQVPSAIDERKEPPDQEDPSTESNDSTDETLLTKKSSVGRISGDYPEDVANENSSDPAELPPQGEKAVVDSNPLENPEKTPQNDQERSTQSSSSSAAKLLQPGAMASSIKLFGQRLQQQQSQAKPPTSLSGNSKRELMQTQKEVRMLRRNIVTLNEQLETAESELQAQRKELETVGERMEKERRKLKAEKETLQKRNADEMNLLKKTNETNLKEQKIRFEEELERYKTKLTEEENRRKQQGGDWNKEMSNIVDREQELQKKYTALEDEKAVLLSQISTLQGQQSVLGSRLESLTQAADNAMERERDAEHRLDLALNQHARQISQRQARESELENTVQELNAALVVSSRGKLENETIGKPGKSNTHLQARITALETDLQAANSQLVMEREQRETLQTQLKSFSNESTQEATIIHAKQIQYDRKIADMSLMISKLEAKLKETKKASSNDVDASARENEEVPNRIKLLSDEVVRLRDKIAKHSSESLAMKQRLKGATDKTNRLEEELSLAKATLNNYGDGDLYDSMERAHVVNGNGRRKRQGGPTSNSSIRTAMLLNSSRGERTEQIGRVVDQIDSFAASTGKYLRRNPLARAGFIFYLMLIHIWTFVLLFFHAHSFEVTPNGDFGSVPHGPGLLIQQQQSLKKDLGTNADASGAIPKLESPVVDLHPETGD